MPIYNLPLMQPTLFSGIDIRIALDLLPVICVGCTKTYEDHCVNCTQQVESIPHPHQMTGSERERAVISLLGLAGHGVDAEICNKVIARLANVTMYEAALTNTSDLARKARENKR